MEANVDERPRPRPSAPAPPDPPDADRIVIILDEELATPRSSSEIVRREAGYWLADIAR